MLQLAHFSIADYLAKKKFGVAIQVQQIQVTYLMNPVSEVITSPGTTRSFRSAAECERDIEFLTVGNLMSTAMLLSFFL